MLRQEILRSLRDEPSGPMLTIPEAAAALEMPVARVQQLVLLGALGGRIEDQRAIGVERASVAARLYERHRDRAVRP